MTTPTNKIEIESHIYEILMKMYQDELRMMQTVIMRDRDRNLMLVLEPSEFEGKTKYDVVINGKTTERGVLEMDVPMSAEYFHKKMGLEIPEKKLSWLR